MSTRHFIFGFGSLVSAESRRKTADVTHDNSFICVVDGAWRNWSHHTPVNFCLHAAHELSESGARGSSALCLQILPVSSGHCANGVIFEVTEDDLSSFDAREGGYDRISIDPALRLHVTTESKTVVGGNEVLDLIGRDTKVWCYVDPDETPAMPHASSQFPICQTYLDVVLLGFYQVGGEDEVRTFLRTTRGWSDGIDEVTLWNDRACPLYPRCDPYASESMGDLWDRLIREELPTLKIGQMAGSEYVTKEAMERSLREGIIRIQSLLIYPIKACQGIRVRQASITPQGLLKFDREWCVVDSTGNRYPAMQSISQRNCPTLATIRPMLIGETRLILSAPGMKAVSVWFNELEEKERVKVECSGASTTSAGAWHLGVMDGVNEGDEVSQWLTQYLNRADQSKAKKPQATYLLVRAVNNRSLTTYMGPTQAPFSTDTSLQRSGQGSPFRMHNVPVKSHDGFKFQDVAPCHLASVQSLEALRSAIKEQFPTSESTLSTFSIRSFRPNIVVMGSREWEEENWREFQIGETMSCRYLKGCPRCTVPARNTTTGLFHFQAPERLRPQKVLRKLFPEKCVDKEWEEEWQGPVFGIHVGMDVSSNANSKQFIQVGDEVVVVRKALVHRPLWLRISAVVVTILAVLFHFFWAKTN